MKNFFLIIYFIFTISFSYSQDSLNYRRILQAMDLYNEYSKNKFSKPIYSDKCYNESIQILNKEFVSNKKFSLIFTPSSYRIDIFNGYFYYSYNNCNFELRYFRKSNYSKLYHAYDTSNEKLEKLENIESNQAFFCKFQIVPAGGLSNTYVASNYKILIYVKIIEMKVLENVDFETEIPKTEKTIFISPPTTSQHVVKEPVLDSRITNFWQNKQTGKDTSAEEGKGSGNRSGGEQGTGSGTGSGFNLHGRSAKFLPVPDYTEQEQGIVVVDFWVDRNGNVTKAIAGSRGTTTSNTSLWEKAQQAALQAKFSVNNNAPKEQKGTITYNFIRLRD
jgi:hypothetical protein